jgi:hypothetical protein
LLKDRGLPFENVQDKARALLDGIIKSYSIAPQQQASISNGTLNIIVSSFVADE